MSETADIRGSARTTRLAKPQAAEPRASVAEAETAPEALTTEAPQPEPKAPPEKRQAGFFPLILGGALAAAAGFVTATYLDLTGSDDELPSRVTGVEQSLTEIGSRLDGIEESVGGFESTLDDLRSAVEGVDPGVLTVLGETVDGLGGEVEGVRASLDALQDTVTNLTISGGDSGDAPDFAAAFDDQMAGFQSEIDRVTAAAEAEVEAARAEAEATRAAAEAEAMAAIEAADKAEAQAKLRAGLAEVQIALDTGAPFESALSSLGDIEVPDALAAVAGDGVLPLAELQRNFPDAARSALMAADRGPDETAGAFNRVTSFLKAQTNARSLEPKDGDNADAILSRAEAALKSGNLGATLGEVEALGEGPAEALGDWLDQARSRNAAVDAVAALNDAIDAM